MTRDTEKQRNRAFINPERAKHLSSRESTPPKEEEKPVDFFISYSFKDVEKAQFFQKALEVAGYSTVFAKRDMPPGSSFPTEMAEGIQKSKRVIFMLSPESWKSAACQSEVYAFYIRDFGGKDRTVIPVMVEPTDIAGSMLAQFVYIDVVGLEPKAAANKFICNVDRAVGRAPRAGCEEEVIEPDIDFLKFSLENSGTLPTRNAYFQHRERDFRILDDNLSKRHGAIIAGASGLGKTQLVTECLYRQSATPNSGLIWVNAHSMSSALQSIGQFHDRLFPKETARSLNAKSHFVREWLGSKKGWTLVLDSAEDLASISGFLPDKNQGRIIITTTNSLKTEWQSLGLPMQALTAFNAKESAAFLAKGLHSSDKEGVQELATLLGGMPLVLEQARSFIASSPGLTVREYISLFKDQQERRSLVRAGKPANYSETIQTAWELNLLKIQRYYELHKENPLAIEILSITVYLSEQQIQPELLWEILSEKCGAERGKVKPNKVNFYKALALLQQHSLLTVRGKNVTTHPILRLLTQDNLEAKNNFAYLSYCSHVLMLHLVLEGVRDGVIPDVYASHAEQCISVSYSQKTSKESIQLANTLGEYYGSCGLYYEAGDIFQEAYKVAVELGTPDVGLQSVYGIACAAKNIGKHDDAMELFSQIIKQINSTKHPTELLVKSIAGLAYCQRERMEYQESIGNYQEALRLVRQIRDKNKQITIDAMLGLCKTAVESLDLEMSNKVWEKVSAIIRTEKIPLMLSSDFSILQAMMQYNHDNNDYDRAILILKNRLDDLHNLFGKKENPMTALCLFWIGKIYHLAGLHYEAVAPLRKSIRIFEEHKTPTQDSRMIFAHEYLGDALLELCQYEAALEQSALALQGLEERKSEGRNVDKFGIIILKMNCATILAKMGKLEMAIKCLDEAWGDLNLHLCPAKEPVQIMTEKAMYYAQLGKRRSALALCEQCEQYIFKKLHDRDGANFRKNLQDAPELIEQLVTLLSVNLGYKNQAKDVLLRAIEYYRQVPSANSALKWLQQILEEMERGRMVLIAGRVVYIK